MFKTKLGKLFYSLPLFFLLIVLCPSKLQAQKPSQPPNAASKAGDLNDLWIDEKGRAHEITQSGDQITLRTESRQEFKGSISPTIINHKIRFFLSHKLNKETVWKDLPDWVQDKLIGKSVYLQGTVNINSNDQIQTIDMVFTDIKVQWEIQGDKRLITNSKLVEIPMKFSRLSLKAHWKEPDNTMGEHLKWEKDEKKPIVAFKYIPK